jgi:UDP-N-acetylmuramoyl-tripeptide--D-alanyl-D-alanine ligase
MNARAAEIAGIVGGSLHGPDAEVDGATIDSRAVRGGELFVPVAAARDGHDFIAAAVRAGAAAYLTARAAGDGSAIAVADTVAALGALGAWARNHLPDRVVGITGSTGKTSTKDLLAAVLRRVHVVAVSPQSFNNELGVPLTLFNAPGDSEVAVVEMGSRGSGHISHLCELARPTVGVVTNVGLAHTSTLGSIEAVARAKSELPAALPAAGTAVLNADDDRVVAMKATTSASVLTYGLEAGDVRAHHVSLDGELRPSFRLLTPWGDVDVVLSARGAHQVSNALAAAAAALTLDVDVDDVAAGLAGAELSPWRMEVSRTPAGAIVVNDAYNANPQSTEAALRALARIDARRHIAVLGPMLELGDASVVEHRRIGDLARALGIGTIVSVGAPEYGGDDVDDVEAARTRLGKLGAGDAVLVKASRAAGLERLAHALVGAPASRPDPVSRAEEPRWSRS